MLRYVLLLSLAGSTLVWPCCPTKREANSSQDDAAGRVLEQLKSMAGEWVQEGGDGPAKGTTAVTYRTTAGGSAVIEVLFPGTEMEMVSVYHRDGKDLVMTHYCMLGNQPRMRAKIGDDPKVVTFELIGGSNLNPAKDAHIHGGVVRWIDRDHVRSEWDFFRNGERIESHKLELVRKP
jgi:hypothetical protein